MAADQGRDSSSFSLQDLFSFQDARDKAPRQANGHDCGVYVLAMAAAIIAAVEETHRQDQEHERRPFLSRLDLNGITPERVGAMRTEVLDLIHALAATAN
mmetsp:Transcript_7309/g.15242  ORF Transcript_7309/g.15242 Transcript_7309/m.15242 type:complete len:100 (-) Transcript_7309:12-311(-)